MEEVRENLKEAVQLIIETNRELARRETESKSVIREELMVSATAHTYQGASAWKAS